MGALRRIVTVVATSLLLVGAAHAADAAGAKAFVNTLASDVLAIVTSKDSKEAQQNKIVALIDDRIDIDFVAKFVLGKHWRTATEAQRTAYMDAYRPFLKSNYVSRLTKYSGQTYTLGTARADGDSFTVPMTIVDPAGTNVNMLYRVEANGKDYRVSDIVVEGVSLLSTQRSEFNSIVSNKGLDHLIQALQKRGKRPAK
jgi:phospholipid transport system substrate-binding protein